VGGSLEALLLLAASGLCGWLGGRALAPAGQWPVRAISYLLAWQLALVLPVQVAGALEIGGLADHASLRSAAVVAIGLALLAWWAARQRETLPAYQLALGGLRLPTSLLAGLSIVILAYGILALHLLVLYPTGWDALAYHLPLSASWLQEGTMRIPSSRAWQFSLPGNAEIAFLVFMATGKQSLVPLANWPAVLMLALSVYLIARRLGSSPKAAVSVALITLSIPIVHHQSFSGYVDLFGTAGLLAALALFLCRRRRDGLVDPRVVFAAALACGLCIGTKPTFFVYAPIFLGAAMFSLMRESNHPSHGAISWMALLSFGALIPSVFWFWRALLETGNPVFPLQVTVGDAILLPGYSSSDITELDFERDFVRSKWEWLIYPWTEWKGATNYLHLVYGTSSGFGGAFATFVPLGMAVAAWQLALGVRRRVSQRSIIMAVWMVCLLVWCVALRRMPRFGLPLWSLACALSAPMLSLAWRYRPVWTGVLLSATLAATSLVSSLGPLYELAASVHFKRFSRADFYGYAKFVDRLPPGSRVVHRTHRTGSFNFLLYGEHLTNRVIPNFEQSPVLTRAFLEKVGADYVVETVPTDQPSLAPVDSLTLVAEETRGKGEEQEVWRLWAVAKSNMPRAADGDQDV
jgi:hypothetical protein